jgi:predicted dehydrogenase
MRDMESRDDRIGRRRFLAAGAGAAAALAAPLAAPAVLARAGERIRLGCIGLGSRGTYLLQLALEIGGIEVVGACDLIDVNVRRAREIVEKAGGKAPDGFGEKGALDYRRMLERKDIDAVIIATPTSLHAPMSIDALRSGKAVLSEVVAAETLEDCRALVRAAEETGRPYMMAENVCYFRQYLLVQNLIDQGLFGGSFTYGECGYVHDCRGLLFNTDGSLTWRGLLYRDGAGGNRYPTHPIGPLARWMGINRTDRFVSLVSMATRAFGARRAAIEKFGAGSPQAAVEFRAGDSTSTLLRTEKGAVVDIRYDIASPRPCRSTVYEEIQGEKACYRSREGEVWIAGKSPTYEWEPIGKYAKEYDHPLWQKWEKDAGRTAHDGADFFAVREFLDALREDRRPPIDVFDAVTWSAIIPLSAESIRRGSAVVEFPDFRKVSG